jgi:hypothetical protein
MRAIIGQAERFVAAYHSDAKTLDVEFLREAGEWKACRYDAGQSV